MSEYSSLCSRCHNLVDTPMHHFACETPEKTGPRRPTWDETFLEIARLTSERSTCKRAHVGGVVARENRMLAAGYNGAPSGMPHCEDVGCDLVYESSAPRSAPLIPHCRRAIHVEQNIIGLAARWGIQLEGATWYFWPFGPCRSCELLLITTHPARIVFPEDTTITSSGEHTALRDAGIRLDIVGPLRKPLTRRI